MAQEVELSSSQFKKLITEFEDLNTTLLKVLDHVEDISAYVKEIEAKLASGGG